METSTKRTLVGMFRNRDNAEDAYEVLKDCGYNADEINVVMTNDTCEQLYGSKEEAAKKEVGNKAMEGAGTGAIIGGTLGAIGAGIAALGTNLLIPGLGLVVLGPLAAGLAGAGAGGVTGVVIGALVGAGIPEEKATIYNEGLKNGKVLISVHPHSDEDAARIAEKWREYKVEDFHS